MEEEREGEFKEHGNITLTLTLIISKLPSVLLRICIKYIAWTTVPKWWLDGSTATHSQTHAHTLGSYSDTHPPS